MGDAELLAAWRSGDATSGETLVLRHYVALFRFLSSKVDNATSADLVQDTFAALCECRNGFRGISSLRTFLLSIAGNKLVDHLRRSRIVGIDFDPEMDAYVDPAVSTTMSSLLTGMRREAMLVRALEGLPLDDQIVLELKEYEGFTAREIAQILSVPPGTVASRIRRARGRLKERMEHLASSGDASEKTLRSLETHMRTVQEKRQQLLHRDEPT